ncbi:MAG: hypothetical protein RhofKO_18520 [Rhodothermales bacterium]
MQAALDSSRTLWAHHPSRALAFADSAQTLLDATPDAAVQQAVWYIRAEAHIANGDYDEAFALGQRILEAVDAGVESPIQRAHGQLVSSYAPYYDGDEPQGLALSRAAYDGFAELGDEYLQLRSLLRAAFAMVYIDEEKENVPNAVQEIIRRADGEAFPWIRGRAYRVLRQYHYSSQRYPEAIAAMQQAIEWYTRADTPLWLAHAHSALGVSYRRNGQFEDALEAYAIAIPRYQEAGRLYSAADVQLNAGVASSYLGQLDVAVAYYTDALATYQQLEAHTDVALVLNNLSLIKRQQGDLATALDYTFEALATQEALGNEKEASDVLVNAGVLYEQLQQLDGAEDMYERALRIKTRIGDRSGQAFCLLNLGTLYDRQGASAKALPLIEQALAIRLDLDPNSLEVAVAQTKLAQIYRSVGRKAEAEPLVLNALDVHRASQNIEGMLDALNQLALFAYNDEAYAEGEAYAQEGLALAQESNFVIHVANYAETLGYIYEDTGDYESALAAFKIRAAANDTLNERNRRTIAEELQAQYATEQQAQQINLLEQRQANQALWIILLGGGIASLLLVLWLLVSRYRLKSRANVILGTLNQDLQTSQETLQAQAHQLATQAERLHMQDEAKTRFFANVSHEFRTPLTLILGPLEDAHMGMHGPMAHSLRDTLGLALKNGRRLLRLVNQLLDVARLEAGHTQLMLMPVDALGFIDQVSTVFRSMAVRKGITYHTQIAPDLGTVILDQEQMEKVIANLLSNAFKFTEAGDTVTLTAKREGAEWVLDVSDTGCGIAADNLPHLFDRFYQADDSSTRKHAGTGIGLALVQEIVKLHGGTIHVASALGEGTAICILLPVHPTEDHTATPGSGDSFAHDAGRISLMHVDDESPVAATLATKPTSDRPTVLCADDNADIRTYLRTHLLGAYHVLEATDGAHALEQARAFTPDLIIADVMMPEMDGFDFCEALRHDPLLDSIPVILLTAKASEDSLVEGLKRGADAYVTKPFSMREVHTRISTLLENRQRLKHRFMASQDHHDGTATPDADEPELLRRLRTCVLTHIADDAFNVDHLAQALGQSRATLYRNLKALGAPSPMHLIWHIRLDYAAQLLQERQGSIGEVAYGVGFKNLSHFSQKFQEQFGMTPSAYVLQHAEAQVDTTTFS